MSTLTISHSHADGTLIDGSVKGDGVYEIARRHGFAYFPSIRAIGIRNSRDRVAKRSQINGCAEALRAAGHEVTVDIDDEPRGRAQVLADQADRLDDRAEALTTKAQRAAAEVESLWRRSDALTEHIPFGQPILIGHHSERRHRRTLEKAQNLAFAAVAKGAEAKVIAQRADAVGSAAAYSAKAGTTGRRITRLEAELRDLDRKLDGYTDKWGSIHQPATGQWRDSLTARRTQLVDQLDYDRQQLAAAVEAGKHVVYSRDNVAVGDLVFNGINWHRVVKVNKVTVSVETGYSWTNKVPFTDIRGHRRPTADAAQGGAA